MSENKKPIGITEVVLRDAHQSLFATRLRIDDMLPIAGQLDKIGYWSLETWGGATFDSCIRYLGEDPWDRLRALKAAMPNTPQQMLLRGQNILGYRHYADDVVKKFVERAAFNGIDIFRVFDAMNDVRNLKTAVKAVTALGKHAQGTISYTVSPVHSIDVWIDMARRLEDLGVDSIAVKDMAGLLKPYVAFDLITRLKQSVNVPIHLHCHATTGLSTATILKSIEAGVDNVDTAISSMSMTYGHSPTESVVALLQDTEWDTGLCVEPIEEIACYFREVRKKYAKFEGALRGVDSRILVAQVPGGMLTNMESQLKEQGAGDKFDEVLKEIPRVRKDLGYIPLVTPTSQIVGTQAVLNILTGERYKTISKETAGVLKGEYGNAPAEFNKELQARVLDGDEPITCRPADLLDDEFDSLAQELKQCALSKGFSLSDNEEDDVLIYALFPQVGLKFLENRHNPSVFEPVPTGLVDVEPVSVANNTGVYTVSVNGQRYVVEVTDGGDVSQLAPVAPSTPSSSIAVSEKTIPVTAQAVSVTTQTIDAPLAGNIVKVLISLGQAVQEGDVVVIMEAMKMETEIRASTSGVVSVVNIKEGDSVAVGEPLLTL